MKSTIKSKHGGSNNAPAVASTAEEERAVCIRRIQAALRDVGAKEPKALQKAESSKDAARSVGSGASDQAWAEAQSKARQEKEARANTQRRNRPQTVGVNGAVAKRIQTARIQEDARAMCCMESQ